MNKYDLEMDNDPSSITGKIMLRIKPFSRVLEFGCAKGRMTRYMKEKLNCDVSIVELDAESFSEARGFAQDGFCGDIEEYGWIEYFSGEIFDYILFADVLEHLRNPETVLRETVQFLRPDGEILVSIPNIGHHDILANLYLNRFSYTSLGLLDNTHIHFWGKENLKEFVSQAGLMIRVLDGAYQEPCHTEQEIYPEELPFALQEALAQREYNELYQFFMVLQKKAWADTHGLSTENLLQNVDRLFTVNCYWDTGEGYQSGFCSQITPKRLPGGKYSFYCAKLPEQCRKVRFDPSLNHFCIISDIHVQTNICSCEIYPLNGVTVNGVTVFCNMNPQMEFCLPEGVQWFEIISGIRLCMGYEYGELFSAMQELPIVEKLRQQLTTLTDDSELLRQSLCNREGMCVQLNEQIALAAQEQADLRNQIDKLSAEGEKAADEKAMLLSRIDCLEERNRDLIECNERVLCEKQSLSKQLQEENEELTAQRDICKEHLQSNASYTGELEVCLQQFREENHLLRQYWDQERNRADLFETQYRCISDAQFWKMTAPLRKVIDIVKRTQFGRLVHQTAQSLRRFGFRVTLGKIRRHFHHIQKLENQASESILTIAAMVEEVQRNDGQIYEQDRLLNAGKRYVLLVGHVLDLTGAPVALGYFAEALIKFEYQPVIIAPSDGALRQTICASGVPVMVYPHLYQSDLISRAAHLFDFLVVNTIVGGPVAAQLNGMAVPVIWWIHEARASYHPGALEAMPQSLQPNMRVYCVGKYADKMLDFYRPGYSAKELLYYIPDYAADLPKEDSFPCDNMEGKTVFAIVGMLEERKGQDIFVQAIRLLPEEQIRQCMFIFLGHPHFRPTYIQIQALCEDYPRNTRFIMELPREEIFSLYRKIDCLVCASRDDPMPIVVTEAMLMSKAVICSENTGSADILERTGGGLIYRNDDPEALAQCISFVHTHKGKELQPMCDRARKAYERFFSQDAFETAIMEVLSEMENDRHNGLQSCSSTVSVVIPTYNAGTDLKALLPLLQSQENVDKVEVIVVDSGSSDGSAELAEQAGAKVLRITQEEFSHSYARNLGAEQASGEYILFMTQDALPDGKLWISGMIQPLLQGRVAAVSCRESPKPDCDLLGRVSIWLHSEYIGILHSDRILQLPKHLDYESLRLNGQLNDVACMVRRDIFLNFRYQGNYAEDLDLGIRLIRAGHRLALLSGVKVIHSHTRSAMYHLKRALVDNETLKKILPDLPCEKIDAQTVANRVITAYCAAVMYIKEAVRYDASKSSWREFCVWTEQKRDEILLKLRNLAVPEYASILKTEAPYADISLREFVEELYRSYSDNFAWNGMTAEDQFYYLTHVLSRYLTASAENFDQKLIQEICDLLIKHLGMCAGALLAAYAVSHPQGNGRMTEIVQQYRHGV